MVPVSERDAHADTLPPGRSRHGFTLAELIVALMLLTVGLLALASTSAFLTYEHAATGRAERAASIGGTRLEILRTGSCDNGVGTETVDGLTVAWSVAPSGHTALATVHVSWAERGKTVVQRYASGFTC
jgi:prepilin-type N-terminal cleavage/methylation domain-containing protein